MPRLPTDLEIFESIYADYADAFRTFAREEPNRATKIYVPIDVPAIATKLNTDAHELFGRLYYHLDHKFRYKQDDGSLVHLFAFAVGGDRHCINYPYLAAILSEHRLEDTRRKWALRISGVALAVSLATFISRFVGS